MRAGQREAAQIVIECRVLPTCSGVAAIACGGELTGQMVGVRGPIVVGQVAPAALHRQGGREAAGMTLHAFQTGVRSRQGERRELCVVELRAEPDIYAVAGLAGDREIGGRMVQRLGGLIVLKMAGDALRAQAGIDTRCRAMMAIVASRHRVGADQREAVAVFLNRRYRHVPPAHRVTAVAVRTELPPVQIRVTLRALCRGLREHQIRVATPASDVMVQPQQRKTGLPVVIEFQLAADWFPRGSGVAVFASALERAMRIRLAAAEGFLSNSGDRAHCRDKAHVGYRTPKAPRPCRNHPHPVAYNRDQPLKL